MACSSKQTAKECASRVYKALLIYLKQSIGQRTAGREKYLPTRSSQARRTVVARPFNHDKPCPLDATPCIQPVLAAIHSYKCFVRSLPCAGHEPISGLKHLTCTGACPLVKLLTRVLNAADPGDLQTYCIVYMSNHNWPLCRPSAGDPPHNMQRCPRQPASHIAGKSAISGILRNASKRTHPPHPAFKVLFYILYMHSFLVVVGSRGKSKSVVWSYGTV